MRVAKFGDGFAQGLMGEQIVAEIESSKSGCEKV
jgi:hypothetical protein